MKMMRSIAPCLLAALFAGCASHPYGEEHQLTVDNGSHPIWAIAPAINLSGEHGVDTLLQSDLVFQQLQAVNNLTVIPVDRVVEVYAALKITKVESEEQAAVVCQQLGCDALVIPTITAYDPYNPPKVGAALQLLGQSKGIQVNNIDARELSRRATPDETQALPAQPGFIQVVGMYDATNGSVRDAVLRYAAGRNDPCGPLASKEYFVSMDRYCGFVYHTLIAQMISRVTAQPLQMDPPIKTAKYDLSAYVE